MVTKKLHLNWRRYLSVALSLALVFNALSLALFVRPVSATALTSMSAVPDREDKDVTLLDYDINFTTPTGAAEITDTIIITWASAYDVSTVGTEDVHLFYANCPGAFDECNTDISSGVDTWKYELSGDVMTLTASTNIAASPISAVEAVTITVENVDANPTTVGVYSIAISGTFGDTGTMYVPIVDDDFVTITASVQSHIQFDLDINDDPSTAVHHPEDIAAYGIDLGTLIFTDYTDEDDVEEIYVDFSTNAVGGMVVDFYSANTSLDSASTSGVIESAADDTTLDTDDTDTCAVGCGNYGVAAEEHGNLEDAGAMTVDATYVDPGAGSIVALPSTWDTIFSSGGAAIQGGDGRVNVRAISGTQTPAADDYLDTLYFRATATF